MYKEAKPADFAEESHASLTLTLVIQYMYL